MRGLEVTGDRCNRYPQAPAGRLGDVLLTAIDQNDPFHVTPRAPLGFTCPVGAAPFAEPHLGWDGAVLFSLEPGLALCLTSGAWGGAFRPSPAILANSDRLAA